MTTGVWLTIIALAVLALVVSNRRAAKPQRGWKITYSPGMPERPTPRGAGWAFTFPTDPQSHVHYVQWFSPPALPLGGTLTAHFRIAGGGFVAQEFPDKTATVSLLIQRRGDNWGAQGEYAAYRWYSGEQVALRTGTYVLSVPLTAEAFGDVYGGHDPQAFATALANVENIGLVFGSAGGRGHGVYATQPSSFTLLSLS